MGSVTGAIGNLVGQVTGGLTGGLIGGAGLDNTYQATAPDIVKQQHILDQIQNSQSGLGGVQGNQQALAQQLLAQSQGQGPNPAQGMLQQATNQNMRSAAGIVSGAKGINPALAARYAGQNAAAANQQSANQSSILRAQQQLAAQGQLGGLYGQMGQQNLGQQQILQEALARQNAATLQGSLGIQGINSGIASGNAGMRRQITGNILGAIGGQGANILGGGGSSSGGGFGSMAGGQEASGLEGAAVMAASRGALVPGHAQVDGDHPDNDTVPAMLSPGEIVIPRSHAKDAESAKAFVEHLLKRKGKK
jgi:hypothetical protein